MYERWHADEEGRQSVRSVTSGKTRDYDNKNI